DAFAGNQLLECRTTLGERRIDKRVSRFADQAIERDEMRRCFPGKPVDTALGRMKAQLQFVEREAVAFRDHQLAVDDELPGLELEEELYYFRKIPPQWLS